MRLFATVSSSQCWYLPTVSRPVTAKADLFEDQTCWASHQPGVAVGAAVEGAGVVRLGVNTADPGGAEAVSVRGGGGGGSWPSCGVGCRWSHGGLGGKRRKVWDNNRNVSVG